MSVVDLLWLAREAGRRAAEQDDGAELVIFVFMLVILGYVTTMAVSSLAYISQYVSLSPTDWILLLGAFIGAWRAIAGAVSEGGELDPVTAAFLSFITFGIMFTGFIYLPLHKLLLLFVVVFGPRLLVGAAKHSNSSVAEEPKPDP